MKNPEKEHHRNDEHRSGGNATPRQGVVHPPSALSGHGDSFARGFRCIGHSSNLLRCIHFFEVLGRLAIPLSADREPAARESARFLVFAQQRHPPPILILVDVAARKPLGQSIFGLRPGS